LPDWYKQKILGIFTNTENLFKQLTPQSNRQQQQLVTRALWGGVHGRLLTDNLDSYTESIVLLLVENFIKGWCLQITKISYMNKYFLEK